MQTSLYPFCNPILKSVKLTIFLICCPLLFQAQTLTGLWTGALSNDSMTARKDQSFEIALTEYRGKVYGYSRSEFIVNDTLYYIVKRVKGTIEGDICEVVDDEIVAYNFRGKLDKGIRVTSTFRRNKSDSSWYLAGTWKTNATKKYYSVTGKVALQEEKDLNASKIFPHLEELKLAGEVAFYKERKEDEQPTVVKLAKPEKTYPAFRTPTEDLTISNRDMAAVSKPKLERKDNIPPVTPPGPSSAETETRPEASSVVKPVAGVVNPESKNEKPVLSTPTTVQKNVSSAPVAAVKTQTPPPAAPRPGITTAAGTENTNRIKQPVAVATAPEEKPVTETKKQDIVVAPVLHEKKEEKTIPVNNLARPVVSNAVINANGAAAAVAQRKSDVSQAVEFRSDSLVLALYDNGQVDGDTVSVLMNGEVIMAKQGLKASAIRKTIYLTPGKDDEFTLVLYAENLGAYPPNTGLLVVYDGEDTYNLRFSADLSKNAGIVFRRKK